MPPTPSRNSGTVDRMRQTQINPLIVVVIALLVVGGLGFFLWFLPAQRAAKAKSEWTTEESAKARSPEGRPVDKAHEAFLESIRKRNASGGPATPRRSGE